MDTAIALPQNFGIHVLALFTLGSMLASSPVDAPVFVQAGTLTSSLAAELTAQGHVIAASRDDATAWLWARAEGGALEVQVVTADGQLLVERTLSTASGIEAALRTSVLLLDEALSAGARVERRGARVWRASASARAGAWSQPTTASTGLTVAVHAPIERVEGLDVGLRVSVDGLGCCGIERAGVTASSVATSAVVEAALTVAAVGPVELDATAAIGTVYRRVTSVVGSFADRGLSEAHGAVEGLARAGVSARTPLFDRVALVAAFGAEVHVGRLRVTVPPPYVGSKTPLDPGLVTPWAELGLAIEIF